jgi:hypothetical protein
MTKFGEKLRDAFTPGHHKQEHEREHVHSTTTEPGMTTTTAAPGTYGTYETGAGYGTGTGTTGEAGYGTAATTTTTTVQEGGAPVMGGKTNAVGMEAPNCEPQYFTRVEDRPQVVERKEYIKEHVPIEQEYKVETYATGKEREAAEGRYAENLGAEERIVAEAGPRATCK